MTFSSKTLFLYLRTLLFFRLIHSRLDTEPMNIYVVLLDGDPVAFRTPLDHEKTSETTYVDGLIESHDRFLRNSLEEGSYTKLYSFNHIVNGFALHTTHSHAEKIKRSDGVRLVEKDRGIKTMTIYTPEFLGLPAVWAQEVPGDRKNAATGEGVVIGVVDTGINPAHPSFAYDPLTPYVSSNLSRFSGACQQGPLFPKTSCNGKIVSARYFSAGAQAEKTLDPSVDILSPFDAVGHGSHVASTAAGNSGVPVVVNGFFYGQASGMAPRAMIAVYKAVYPTIGTLVDVLAAIEQATRDGVDILLLSVGPNEPPEDTSTFLGAFDIFMLSAWRAGVFVAQAVGNNGPSPYSVVSYSPWTFGVASCRTDRKYPATLFLGDGRKVRGIGLSGSSWGDGMIQHKLVLANDAAFPNATRNMEECQSPEAFDPAVVGGSVVICTFSAGFRSGTSNLRAVIQTAEALQFAGFVLVASPAYGDYVAQPIPFPVPGILIPRTTDAQVISDYYEEHTTTRRDGEGGIEFHGRAMIGDGRIASYEEEAPIVSRFSSRGPDFMDRNKTPVDILKPDILAPGEQIWAAWSPMSATEKILHGHNFALISGTSMAAPHIAGIGATMKQKYPSWTPSMIASALSTTASKHDNRGQPIMAQGSDPFTTHPAAPFGYGAGLVDPLRALDPGLIFSSGYEDYIGFLCSLPNTAAEEIRTATGGSCESASLTAASDLNLPSVTVTALSGNRTTRRVVMNVADKPETYVAGVNPPEGVEVGIDPAWFTVAPGETQTLEIKLTATRPRDDFSFGEIVLTGNLNHIVRAPLSVLPVSV